MVRKKTTKKSVTKKSKTKKKKLKTVVFNILEDGKDTYLMCLDENYFDVAKKLGWDEEDDDDICEERELDSYYYVEYDSEDELDEIASELKKLGVKPVFEEYEEEEKPKKKAGGLNVEVLLELKETQFGDKRKNVLRVVQWSSKEGVPYNPSIEKREMYYADGDWKNGKIKGLYKEDFEAIQENERKISRIFKKHSKK